MKKLILTSSLFLFIIAAFAQSEKYIKAMQDKVAAVDTTHTVAGLKDLSAAFERIGDAEKTQWLPYYYAALTQVNAANIQMSSGGSIGMGNNSDKTDPFADKAEQLLNKADALTKDNSEIYVVKKMIASLRLMGDPMNRYAQYLPQIQQALETATKLNPENPRIYLIKGEDQYFTPEQYGGSKTEAKKLFEQALQKYDTFKPASPIDPNWGKGTTQYFLSQIK